MALFKEFSAGNAMVSIYDDAQSMGRAVADRAEELIAGTFSQNSEINLLFSVGESQFTTLEALTEKKHLPWDRINLFHVDEKITMKGEDPRSNQMRLRRFLDRVPYRTGYFFNGIAPDPQAECGRYAGLLEEHPIHIAFIGIGVNGHMAFNEPGQGRFDDPEICKVIALSEQSKRTNVEEGIFPSYEDVPSHGLTITLPGLMKVQYKLCPVPYALKAEAVHKALRGPITEEHPASLLRMLDGVTVYLDRDSAARML